MLSVRLRGVDSSIVDLRLFRRLHINAGAPSTVNRCFKAFDGFVFTDRDPLVEQITTLDTRTLLMRRQLDKLT